MAFRVIIAFLSAPHSKDDRRIVDENAATIVKVRDPSPESSRSASDDSGVPLSFPSSAESSPLPFKNRSNHAVLSRRQKKNRTRVLHQQEKANSDRRLNLDSLDKKEKKRRKTKVKKRKPKKIDKMSRHQSNHDTAGIIEMLLADKVHLYDLMRRYLATTDQLVEYGYPLEHDVPGSAYFYRNFSSFSNNKKNQLNVNAREFWPRDKCHAAISDSSNSLPNSVESSDAEQGNSSDSDVGESVCQRPKFGTCNGHQTIERHCVRCSKSFLVDRQNGDYVDRTQCRHHRGRFQSKTGNWECCGGMKQSKTCAVAEYHVWSGLQYGINGPFYDYKVTKPSAFLYGSEPSVPEVYSLDCEMCYTKNGLELAKVTLLELNGTVKYESFVKPEFQVLDYNTRFSGITPKDLTSTSRKLKDVQEHLLKIITADTILIGHGLENDLKALKMIHHTLIDTAIMFPHEYGAPYRKSLKSLCKVLLNREIQTKSHDSREDAKAAADLVLERVALDVAESSAVSSPYIHDTSVVHMNRWAIPQQVIWPQMSLNKKSLFLTGAPILYQFSNIISENRLCTYC